MVVVNGDRLSSIDSAFLVEQGIVTPNEEIDFFYSDGMLSILEDGNLLTNMRLISYEKGEEDYEIYAEEIDKVSGFRVYKSESFLDNTIIEISATPVIALGSLGSFDDSLALACSLVDINGIKYMYYVGWMKGNRVRYYPSIGLAISKDKGKTFQKYSNAPLIERTNNDPYGMASPFVLAESTGWKMWYASYRKWELRKNEPWPTYELRFAESTDGINWSLSDKNCIGSDNEEAVARPYVIKEQNLYWAVLYLYPVLHCIIPQPFYLH